MGCTIRQISRADLKGETLFADVGPCLVPTDSPFGRVQRNLNLVLTSGKYGGDMAFLGAGAGGDPSRRRWTSTKWCRPKEFSQVQVAEMRRVQFLLLRSVAILKLLGIYVSLFAIRQESWLDWRRSLRRII